MVDSRVNRIPQYYARKFPEYRGQTPEAFLKQYDPLVWQGYDKTPNSVKVAIIRVTQLLVRRKAELLRRRLGWYTTRKGRRYPRFTGDLVFIMTKKGTRVYQVWYNVATKRFGRRPAWYP